jgi:hypothetical protein
MSSKTQFKCSNKVMTSSGREVTCGAFLMEVNDGIFNENLKKSSTIKVRCRKCSMLYTISISKEGEMMIIGTPEKKKEEDYV